MTLPFENNTSTIVRKIASAQLKHDKLKKGVSIFAIALATFLMSAVLLLISGVFTMNTNGGNYITGSYHALVSNITQEQYSKLFADKRIELLGFNAPIGSIKVDDERLNISCSDAETLTLNGLSILEGQMPEQKNGILIEKEFLLNQNMNAGIGDTISLPMQGGQGEKDFVISGYLKTKTKGTDRNLYAAIVSMKYFEEIDGWNTLSTSAMFRLNSDIKANLADIKNAAIQISADAGIEKAPLINETFIELSKPSFSLIAVAVAGLAIVIMASILVIYCIFYISIINSIKEYGQLRTIGMTAKQIKRLIFKQGLSLMFVAVPMGLIAGIILSYLLIPQGFRLSNLLWVCSLVIVLVYVTVRLSIRKPAMIAAKVSPIEASQFETGNMDIHSHKHKRLTPFFLAKEQILCYKKKNLLTILSLILTGILLLGVSSILSSINVRDMSLALFPRGQFIIGYTFQELTENTLAQAQINSPFTESVDRALSSLSGFEKITDYQNLPVSIDLHAEESDNAIVGFEQEDMSILQSCATNGTLPDYETLASENQLIIGRPKSFESDFGVQPKVGSFVTLRIFDGDHVENMKFEIAAILDQSKMGDNSDRIDMLILPVASLQRIGKNNLTYQYAVRVDDDFLQQAEKEIDQIIANNPRLSVSTLSAVIEENSNFLQGMQIALAVASGFIGCFSVMNLLNTVLTGIIVRRREFALMRSVGMSRKQLSTMICYEGMLIVSIGLMLSLIVGGSIGYALCEFLKDNIMTYLSYQFPFGVSIIYCVLFIICTLAITKTALKQQNKFSLIELVNK